MRTLNGQNNCARTPKDSAEITADARNKSSITPLQEDLISMIYFFDPLELAENLKRIHDMALYHTDMAIDRDEINALYQVNELSEFLKKMAKEA